MDERMFDSVYFVLADREIRIKFNSAKSLADYLTEAEASDWRKAQKISFFLALECVASFHFYDKK